MKGIDTCPSCNGASRVTDSRRTEVGISRRRRCEKCGAKWSTKEVPIGYGLSRRDEIMSKSIIDAIVKLAERVNVDRAARAAAVRDRKGNNHHKR